MMTISIQPATKAHIPTMVTMWQAIDQFPQGERPFGGDSSDKPLRAQDFIERTLQLENAAVLIARNDKGDTIGTISGHVFEKPAVQVNPIGVIYGLWVEDDYRRQGIATRLLKHLENELQKKGAKAFQVGWDVPNTLAAAWWQKQGYLPYEVIASKMIKSPLNTGRNL